MRSHDARVDIHERLRGVVEIDQDALVCDPDLANTVPRAVMSRLPRLRSSSPDRPGYDALPPTVTTRAGPSTSMASNSLKRKAQENIGIDLQPRKLAAIAEGDASQPLRPSKAASNVAAAGRLGKGPPPLTKPRAPLAASTTVAASRRTRATSAPPKTAPVRPPTRPVSRTAS